MGGGGERALSGVILTGGGRKISKHTCWTQQRPTFAGSYTDHTRTEKEKTRGIKLKWS